MNKMNIKTIFLIAIVSSIGISACTERIDIDLDSTYTRCVVYGEITTDTTTHKVIITRSANYFSNSPAEGISGAIVTISDGQQQFVLNEDPLSPGIYLTQPNVFGVEGRTYTLTIDNVDLLKDGEMKSYSASSFLPPVNNPDSIKVIYRPEWRGWVVQAFALDSANRKDFYMFHTWLNGTLETDSLSTRIIADDLFFNGSYTNGITIKYWEGQETLLPGDTIVAGFCGITENYYKFIDEVRATIRPSSPLFSAPPANPRTNISNNAIGFFTAYSLKRATYIIPSNP
jgi:hypothetical protein